MSETRKRIILIVVIVVVLAGLGGGIAWYLRRNTSGKLLQRVQVALRAEKFDHAADLARQYIAKEPENWKGYYMLGQALSRQGEYAEARKAFEDALGKDADRTEPRLGLADTYALPARRYLSQTMDQFTLDGLDQAIEGLRKADGMLAESLPEKDEDRMEFQRLRGIGQERIGFALRQQARLMEDQARIAKAAEKSQAREEAEQKARQYRQQAGEASQKAYNLLLEVVRSGQGDDMVGQLLWGEAMSLDDPDVRAKAAEAIGEHLKDMPVANMEVRMQQLQESLAGLSMDKQDQALREGVAFLEKLIAEHPRAIRLKISLARLKMMQDKPRESEEICRAILDEQEGQHLAQLLLAQSLLAQNRVAEAESELFALKTRLPNWPEAHYFYALAAERGGKSELAKSSMRSVTKLAPNFIPARQYMAQTLLREGYHTEALEDARALYNYAPDNPDAVLLYAQALALTGERDFAKRILLDARQAHPEDAGMLSAIQGGMELLGDGEELARTARMIVELPIQNVQDSFAAARAMLVLERTAEAEKLLRRVVDADPRQAKAWYELGRLYDRTGRFMQALESYRHALRIEPKNTVYAMAVAERLFDSGLMDEAIQQAQSVLAIDPRNPQAKRIVNEAKLILGSGGGESPAATDPLPQGAGERTWRFAAVSALQQGNPQQCIELCKQRLQEDKDDQSARLLMADAHLQLGEIDQFLEPYTDALKADPTRLPIYMRIASVLTDQRSPEEAKAYLEKIPGVRGRLVELAMAQVLTQRRQYDRALVELDAFLARPGLPDNVRNWGRLRQADTLAAAGKRDEALALLNELQAEDVWQKQADLRKGRLLLAQEASRNEGEQLLETLAKQARKDSDLALLEQIATTFQQARMPEQALLVCGHLEKLQPKEAKPLLLRARLLSQMGNFADAETAYEEALQRQPGNLDIYLELARLMDLQHKTPETLAVLDRLAQAGETGKVYALFEKARMLGKGWGLLPQAIQAIDELKSMGHGKEPWIQVELANAFIQLGLPAKARSILEAIPAFSRHYLQARMMLADLEDDPKTQESILADLARRYPENPRVQEAMMQLLADEKAYDQALASYGQYREQLGNRPLVLALPERAVQIALQADDLDAAAGIAEDIASKTALPVWRNRAILLDLARKSPQAGQMLQDKDAPSDGLTAVMGVAWAVLNDKPDQAKTFAEIMDSIRRQLADRSRNPHVLYEYAFLADLARGEVDQARSELKPIQDNLPRIKREPMTGLMEKVAKDPAARKQAARLLEALVAQELQLPRLAESIAENIFQSDPGCLWAGSILMTLDPDRADEILQNIQPADGFMARFIRGEMTLRQGQYKQAYDLYTKLQQTEPNNIQWLYLRAVASERMGQRDQALELYRQLLAKGMHLLAANNAAYIISQLHPDDEQQLEQAAKWIEEVVRLQPTVPAFRDTQGWILHLQGENDRAARLVRAAAKGIPDSTEVHYHLAAIEHALGNEQLARWHVDAAIERAEAQKRNGETLEVADEKALEAARKLRSKMAGTPVSAGQE